MWGPCGDYADSATTLGKTGIKNVEGSSLHWFCKLGDALYSVLRLEDDFVTRWQIEGPSVYFFLPLLTHSVGPSGFPTAHEEPMPCFSFFSNPKPDESETGRPLSDSDHVDSARID
jgi:hypothetical protein